MRYSEFGDYFALTMRSCFPDAPQSEIANELNTSQGNISKIMKGYVLPSEELLQTIKEKTGIDLSDSVRKAGKKYRDLRNAIDKGSIPEAPTETRLRLPVSAAAGRLADYSVGILREQCEQVPVIRSFPDYDYTMYIKGNSMEPKYESGDEIAIKKAEFVIEWGKDYVLDTQDGVIFKKIYDEGDNIRCVSYNHEEYPDFLVPKSVIYGYYRFVGLIRV